MEATNILDPINDIKDRIHIIGCGAIGSNLAVMLTRLGAVKLELWDADTVEEHNITNQAYTNSDIGRLKVEALADHLLEINPNVIVIAHTYNYEDERLSGHVFMAVDSIETRNNIVDINKLNQNIKTMGDFRMGTYQAQAYLVPWKGKHIQFLKDTMNFTDEEAEELTPVSPCGTHMSVLPTIQTVVSAGVQNWIALLRNREHHKIIGVNLQSMVIMTI